MRTHGLLVARYSFIPGRRGNSSESRKAYACWCVALYQAVQLVAGALIHECAQHGRLFWVPDEMIAIMQRMGCNHLMGPARGGGELLSPILAAIDEVRWHLVDTEGNTCAHRTFNGTTVLSAGDAVSWDP